MAIDKLLKVEVAYGKPDGQRILVVQVPEGATLEEVIQVSGMLELFPEIDLSRQAIGIFSQKKALSDNVKEGDRIEIYRPLVIDPKEARRGRVRK